MRAPLVAGGRQVKQHFSDEDEHGLMRLIRMQAPQGPQMHVCVRMRRMRVRMRRMRMRVVC